MQVDKRLTVAELDLCMDLTASRLDELQEQVNRIQSELNAEDSWYDKLVARHRELSFYGKCEEMMECDL